VVAFCGHIHQDGTADLLRKVARVMAELGGHLDIYTMLPPQSLVGCGLELPTVRHMGFFPASEMGEKVGQSAHVLFLPASFEQRERDDVATLFPSKLADYTAVGLPILIWGPKYSSAVGWADEHPGSMICVTEPDPAAFRTALVDLVSKPTEAAQMASAAMDVGDACFNPKTARAVLYRALRGFTP
jgi:hypothetical protein